MIKQCIQEEVLTWLKLINALCNEAPNLVVLLQSSFNSKIKKSEHHIMYIFFINHPELSTCTDIKEKEDSEKLKEEEDMNRGWILLGILCLSYIPSIVRAGKAACHDPFYRRCYGIPHTCPAGCPKLCEIDCRLCKPYCCKICPSHFNFMG